MNNIGREVARHNDRKIGRHRIISRLCRWHACNLVCIIRLSLWWIIKMPCRPYISTWCMHYIWEYVDIATCSINRFLSDRFSRIFYILRPFENLFTSKIYLKNVTMLRPGDACVNDLCVKQWSENDMWLRSNQSLIKCMGS